MLRVEKISKKLGVFNIQSISFDVKRGEYFILLGPSGAGKSVVLEMIAGLIQPDSGDISINSISLSNLRIQQRNVGLVFQDLALFPHLSVKQNIAYPLQRRGISRAEVYRKVIAIAKNLSIEHLLRRFPPTLSGGEQQRVALARTLITNPDILLLDEPLSSLDVEKKSEIRKLLRELNRDGQTIMHVTHDYEEAIALGHKIAVMHNGNIEQMGTPQEIFSKPTSSFVAGFGGIKNFFEAELLSVSNDDLVQAKLNNDITVLLLGNKQGKGYITFPENAVSLNQNPSQSSSLNQFKGKVVDLYPQRLGMEVVVDIGIKVYSLVTHESVKNLNIDIGHQVWISFKATSVNFIEQDA